VSTGRRRIAAVGFHDGELAVQRREGVAAQATRLAGMLAPAQLRGGIVRFLADRTFAALTGRDRAGQLWISPLAGPPGYLQVDSPTTLTVHGKPEPGDPLHALSAGQPVGLVVIEFATRRRVRINGALTAAGDRLIVEVEQAYGNCPQYIRQRRLQPCRRVGPADAVRRGTRLADAGAELIRRADTFFIGTTHPTRGADASHRGGPPGIVRIEDGELCWPDYPGNNMFNTLGNLTIDPAAALLFADYTTGHTVQLSGTAAIERTARGGPYDDNATGRRIRFAPEAVIAGRLLPLRAATSAAHHDNHR
jgi:predicted pyridoxine 5'-phosphate oxidase superfamily flavin-nucleotide-binding protein